MLEREKREMDPHSVNVLKEWKEKNVHQRLMFFETIHNQHGVTKNLKSVHSKDKRKPQKYIDCSQFSLVIRGIPKPAAKCIDLVKKR